MSKFFNNSRSKTSASKPRPDSEAVPNLDSFLSELKDTASEQVASIRIPEMQEVENVLRGGPKAEPIPPPLPASVLPTKKNEYRTVILPAALEKTVLNESLSDAKSAEAYRQLRTRLMAQRRTSHFGSLVVSSAAPSEGKTLNAINLAASFSHLENFRVLLVDADLRTAGASRTLQVEEGPGMYGILERKAAASDAIAATNFPDLYFLNAGRGEIPASELFATASWKEFVAWSTHAFDLVVIDSPPILPVPDFDLIVGACDRVLLVVRSFKSRLTDVEQAIRHVDSKKFCGYVLNGSRPLGGFYEAYGKPDPNKSKK